MVSAGGAFNVARHGIAPRSRGTLRALWRIALLSSVASCAVLLFARREPVVETIELKERAIGLHHKLTPQERAFVEHSTSTPDLDLHKAAKLQSEKAAADMDRYYKKQQAVLENKDKVARQHLETMHKKASTKAAQKDIDSYFDSMTKVVKKEHVVELKKHKGTGAAARAEANLYFKQLQAKQEKQNKEDEARLRAESTFHSKHGTAVAAQADLNAWFDTLQAKTKQEDIKRAKLHPTKSANPYSFVTPTAAKQGGEAVHVHVHDEEGIQMSTKAADNDLNSYFDNLDKKQAAVNQHDVNALSDNHRFEHQAKKRSTKQSNEDVKDYFHKLHSQVKAVRHFTHTHYIHIYIYI